MRSSTNPSSPLSRLCSLCQYSCLATTYTRISEEIAGKGLQHKYTIRNNMACCGEWRGFMMCRPFDFWSEVVFRKGASRAAARFALVCRAQRMCCCVLARLMDMCCCIQLSAALTVAALSSCAGLAPSCVLAPLSRLPFGNAERLAHSFRRASVACRRAQQLLRRNLLQARLHYGHPVSGDICFLFD